MTRVALSSTSRFPRLRTTLALATFALGLPATALSASKTDHRGLAAPNLANEGRHAPTSRTLRHHRVTSWETPVAQSAAWTTFVESYPGQWRAQWDPATNLPVRLWGPGVSAPGSNANPARAEAAVRDLLRRHGELLLGGLSHSDLELSANRETDGIRTVAFLQRSLGRIVVGGQVSARIKNDRIAVIASELVPADYPQAGTPIPVNAAVEIGESWLMQELGAQVVEVSAAREPVALPIVWANLEVDAREAWQLRIHTQAPVGDWTVFVDRQSGEALLREQNLRFGQSRISMRVSERWFGGTRVDAVAPLLDAGSAGTTDTDGVLNFDGVSTSATFGVFGDAVEIVNHAGTDAVENLTLEDGVDFLWDGTGEEILDAQLNAFIASGVARSHAGGIAPSLAFAHNQVVEAHVNLQGESCNAYSDGTTINFFRGGNGCSNTARLNDVVYHEYGHSFHAHALIPGAGDFDGALSEGGSDYFAATIADDPAMGRGFFGSEEPLRHIDPTGSEAVWPRDADFDTHTTGLIIGGALWDLRKALENDFPKSEAAAITDRFLYALFQRASDIPTSYVEVLLADDDDGDLSNGTPNQCAINGAFGKHGLADPRALSGLGAPIAEGLQIHVPVAEGANCPEQEISEIILRWRPRADITATEEISMVREGANFVATLDNAPLAEVIQYQLRATLGSGATLPLPANDASPWYELFTGAVYELYCTDFEANPGDDGWTHELLAGEATEGADDWQWGVPQGMPGSGDPDHAYSGSQVYGNDLGGGDFNGSYQSNKRNALHSPSISISGHDHVRLQYRRWLVIEDGRYDRAAIEVDGLVLWSNHNGGGDTHHIDREWRFHDVDLRPALESGADSVKISYTLTSDQGLELGGWTLDDFCVVSLTPETPCTDCGASDGPGGKKKKNKKGCAAAGANAGWLGLLALGMLIRRRRS